MGHIDMPSRWLFFGLGLFGFWWLGFFGAWAGGGIVGAKSGELLSEFLTGMGRKEFVEPVGFGGLAFIG